MRGQRLPAEEEPGVVLVEDLQAAERALDLQLGLVGAVDPEPRHGCRRGAARARLRHPGLDWKSTFVVRETRAGSLPSSRTAPGRRTGMSRNSGSETRRLIADPHLLGLPRSETSRARRRLRTDLLCSRTSSRSSCHGSPGTSRRDVHGTHGCQRREVDERSHRPLSDRRCCTTGRRRSHVRGQPLGCPLSRTVLPRAHARATEFGFVS